MPQKTLLERFGIFGILQAQRIERAHRRLAAGGDHLAEQLGDALAEQRFQPPADKSRKLFKSQPADQQCLEADRDLPLQRPS